jgi:hypothetical protein
LETAQKFFKLIIPKLIKSLNYYKSERYQSQRVLNKVFKSMKNNLSGIHEGFIIKNPSQNKIQEIMKGLKENKDK